MRKLLVSIMPFVGPLIRFRNQLVLKRFASTGNDAKSLVDAHLESMQDPEVAGSSLIPQIEEVRAEFAAREEPLVDGTLGESVPWDSHETIASACKASRMPKHAAYLYHLIRTQRPKKVLELGTNLGVSGAYIAAALKEHGGGRLVTMDASPYRQRLARSLFEKIGLDNVDCVLGDFADTFDKAVEEHGPFDFAFIDGNHKLDPTLHYAREVSKRAEPNVWIVFDDIRWSEGMEEAWRRLHADPHMLAGLDLYRLSLCIMTKNKVAKPAISKPIYGAFR